MSGGARRPFLLAHALRDAGASVFVVAPSLPDGEDGCAVSHPNRDPSAQISPRKKNLRDFSRDWLLWPDPDIRWASRAADAAATAYANYAPGAPDWVLTTSPPESIHAAGRALKQLWPQVKWAADFRDHWLDAPHRRERLTLHRRIGERLIAQRWLTAPDLITSVDKFIADELQTLGASAPHVLSHFAPPDLGLPAAALPADAINIVHAGSIALSDPLADINDLLKPFSIAAQTNPRLRLHFVGRLTDTEHRAIEESPAATAIDLHGVKPYEEALGFIVGADGLAYIASAKGNVPPSKIIEYLATDKPIIACGEGPWRRDHRVNNADSTDIMKGLHKGDVRQTTIRPPSAKETAERLLQLMARAG
ncbi:MAG: hypothetical protein DHS20C05_20070 [Hyphococcus sp.]|nr:MAG: hypothetical protein DHS20C05_20070 [Marinicaulis sp.]